MGDANEVERLKRLTLDLLAGNRQWMSFVDIAEDFRDCDGGVDPLALVAALDELAVGGHIQREERAHEIVYRIASPQEGESLAEKVTRLEAHVETLTKERDHDSALALRLRRELKADRAAVRSLLLAMPVCWVQNCNRVATMQCGAAGADDIYCDRHDGGFEPCEVGDNGYAAPLRALQARMATWPSEAEAPAHHAAAEGAPDDVQAGSRGLSFEEAARRYPEAFERALDTVAGRSDGLSGSWSNAPVWPQSIRFLRTEDPATGELLYQRLPAPRYVGEFGDIDEPSVGDVDGYGRRG